MNSHVSATIGIKAVDSCKLADDNFCKRMGNFDRICKQIDEKHDHVMEMLANIQEQLRILEMNRRKGSRVDFGVANAQSQIQFSSLDQSSKPAPKGENEGISSIEVVTGSATISKSSNDTKLENKECVEVLKYVPSIATVAMEAYYSTIKATEIQEQRVFDEMPESEKSRINDILPPLVEGSEAAEVYNFDVSSPQFQTPLVSTEETKMELECFSLIPSPSSFGFSLDDTKLEDEGLVDVPIHTSVAELQLQESKSEFERLENFPDLSLPKFIPSWRIMVSSLLHLPFLYKCYSVEALTKEELIWLDTGQYLMVSGLSREGMTSNFIVSWKLINAMYWDRNRLVSEMQLKSLEVDLSTIEAEKHFVEVKTFVIKPNIITYSTLLPVLCDAGKMSEARSILKEMVKTKLECLNDKVSSEMLLNFRSNEDEISNLGYEEHMMNKKVLDVKESLKFRGNTARFAPQGSIGNSKVVRVVQAQFECVPDYGSQLAKLLEFGKLLYVWVYDEIHISSHMWSQPMGSSQPPPLKNCEITNSAMLGINQELNKVHILFILILERMVKHDQFAIPTATRCTWDTLFGNLNYCDSTRMLVGEEDGLGRTTWKMFFYDLILVVLSLDLSLLLPRAGIIPLDCEEWTGSWMSWPKKPHLPEYTSHNKLSEIQNVIISTSPQNMNDFDDIGLVQGSSEPYTSKWSSLWGYTPQMEGHWSGTDFDLEGCMRIVLLGPSFLHQVNLECCIRFSSKSPSHVRHWSLGDKTLSRGEYCHGTNGGERGFG